MTGADRNEAENRTEKTGSLARSGGKIKAPSLGKPFQNGFFYRLVGLIGKHAGWTVTFGGNAGGRPRIGDVVAEKLAEEDAAALVHRCLTYYQQNARKKERTARFMERTGLDALNQALGLP